MARWMAVVSLTVGALVGACTSLEEELLYEPCTVPADCWHTQECARTKSELQLGLPGLCLPAGSGCNRGAQLGCVCDPADPAMSCYTTSLKASATTMYPQMVCDEALAVCVVAPPPEDEL